MIYCEKGNPEMVLSDRELNEALLQALEQLHPARKVLVIPPDITRFHSRAGDLTETIWKYYGSGVKDILPAIGTHAGMTTPEIRKMFGSTPPALFREHDWRRDVVTLGEVPEEYLDQVSEGLVSYRWPAQVNRLLAEGGHDLILSVGQVVPHEVIGMANHNKNLFIGTGGPEGINKSHYLGAVYGMERIMGRADTPVRRVLNYAARHFTPEMPVVYVLTVIGREKGGDLVVRGLYIGDDEECFRKAATLSSQVNLEMLAEPIPRVVVYLDPAAYRSTWLGNKSIYRTRMAIADRGELVVLAPGLAAFGEDREIDRLIRKFGYRTTPEILQAVSTSKDLQDNLSAAAHLIHGSPEGRFKVTYCPGHLSRQEVESVHYSYAPLQEMIRRYDPHLLREGFNTLPDGEKIYYISDPGLGLWSWRDKFTA